ncbi:PHA/PHB synthase family protein [Oricola cellulosilytica]|uniref:Class I poly(R)-hydroxyalkanoic acid synthase n=1 Tax=Oricola cellulosilytica TaxID=1429082 RepID=A0A4R0P674_9HYPH|nr:class I poly(R)-hydroxyalkanoic acid synthase [Oricola cellulosilytica]TCD12394.1 class I poly(R)-hydroxyalkanoic acid synthase [Oricola cellulosilytica]
MAEKQESNGSGSQKQSIEAYVIKDHEAFARNLARVIEEAGHAASAWIAPRESGEKTDAYADNMADAVKTLSKVSEYWLSDPQRALEAQTRLFSSYLEVWSNSIKRMGDPGVSEAVETPHGDKRFADEDWKENAFFSFLKQTYLVTSKWVADLVEHADTLDEHTRHKAGFYVKQLTNAISPSNFMVSNPEIFKETIATNGANLVTGMKMLAEDIEAGGGDLKVRQADYSKFELGRNIAITPGKVIARSPLAEIIQYEPTTAKVLKRPLLICPPWINKFYILDLNPDKSFIRWAVAEGHTVFVISWANPDERHAEMDWNDYIDQGLRFGLDAVEKATGEKKVNAIGYCVGGTLLAAAMALFAREKDNRIATATLFTTQVDFVHAGDLKVFVDDDQLKALEKQMKRTGYLEGSRMATAFNLLRSGDLVWPYVINNYMKGREPLPFDLLYWNADSTRMSAANHIFYLRNCYHENNLARGKLVLDGAPVTLKDVKVPIYNLATKEDHIAPALSVFEGSKLFGGKVTYVMGGSGHIAGVINPPHRQKYQFWHGPKVKGDLSGWIEKADVTEGSWWPHWQAWIEAQDSERVNARTKLGSKKLKPLEDAPGSYVKIRV